MTRAELLEALSVERFGTRPNTQKRRPTHAEVTTFELENERAQQRIRRQILEEMTHGNAVGTA